MSEYRYTDERLAEHGDYYTRLWIRERRRVRASDFPGMASVCLLHGYGGDPYRAAREGVDCVCETVPQARERRRGEALFALRRAAEELRRSSGLLRLAESGDW